LLEKEATVSTAERCTGGNIAKMITSVPGSSAYFKGSVVAYDNDVKQSLLSVAQYSLDHFGAVSQQVVEQMAVGVLKLMATDYAIATSGIAGPDGGTDEKPVGTTWIAVASKAGVTAKKFSFGDNRERNITRASSSALNMLREVLLAE
jgi:nicotinamide-nucleotide amidase